MNPWNVQPVKTIKNKKSNTECSHLLLNIQPLPLKVEKKAIDEILNMEDAVANSKQKLNCVDMTVEEFSLNSILNSHLKRNKKLSKVSSVTLKN
jgi:hypothetical protein